MPQGKVVESNRARARSPSGDLHPPFVGDLSHAQGVRTLTPKDHTTLGIHHEPTSTAFQRCGPGRTTGELRRRALLLEDPAPGCLPRWGR